MLEDFKDYLETKRRENLEHSESCRNDLIALHAVCDLIKEHIHYKKIDARVLKKIQEPYSVAFYNEYGKTMNIYYKSNMIRIHLHGENTTAPTFLLERLEGEIERYKRGMQEKDYSEEEEYFKAVSELVKDNKNLQWIAVRGIR